MTIATRRLGFFCRPSILAACALLCTCCGETTQSPGDAGPDASRLTDSSIDAPTDSTADAADVSTPDVLDASTFDASDALATTDGAGDALAMNDAPTDGAGDAPIDAPACPPISQVCADAGSPGGSCVTSWSSASHPDVWCSRFPNYRVFIATSCNGFDVVVIGGVDTSTFYDYDPGTGQLVGIEAHGLLGVRCIAGESPDVPLADCSDGGSTPFVCLSDGGVSP